jgi:hypothetical protein
VCPLLESDEATVATLVLLILWAVGVFIYDQWWKRRGESEYKQSGRDDHPIGRLPTTINIRYSREEKGKQ